MDRKEYKGRDITAEDRTCVQCGRRLRPEQQCFSLGEVFCSQCMTEEETDEEGTLTTVYCSECGSELAAVVEGVVVYVDPCKLCVL